MEKVYISKNSLKRIPFYLSFLKEKKAEGLKNISSTTIAKALSLNDVQVRKDLALVSISGGRPKVGYEIERLIFDIEVFLGLNNSNTSILVGAGSLGKALLGYKGFEEYGVKIVAAFDNDPQKIGQEISSIKILDIKDLKSFCQENMIHIGIITVSLEEAQKTCDLLIDSGVKAIWNFAQTKLSVPDGILIQNENMAASLAILSRHLNQKTKK